MNDFIDNKLLSEDFTSESKKHFLLLFPYEDVGLLAQEVVSAATTTTTINSTDKRNINNYTRSDTSSTWYHQIQQQLHKQTAQTKIIQTTTQ